MTVWGGSLVVGKNYRLNLQLLSASQSSATSFDCVLFTVMDRSHRSHNFVLATVSSCVYMRVVTVRHGKEWKEWVRRRHEFQQIRPLSSYNLWGSGPDAKCGCEESWRLGLFTHSCLLTVSRYQARPKMSLLFTSCNLALHPYTSTSADLFYLGHASPV